MCSTKNPGVGLFDVDFFMWIISVDLHVDIKWSLGLIFFTCNPRCIDFLMWIIGVVYIVRWIIGVGYPFVNMDRA